MELHTLKPAKGSIQKSKRVGRGQGSGKGGTSTKGHNGAQSRSGYKTKAHFEGGQMPLQRRVPKFGFTNPNRIAYKPINLATLQLLSEKIKATTIDLATLQANGLAGKQPYKILSKGKEVFKTKLSVTAHAFSAEAKATIEKLGGIVVVLTASKNKTSKLEEAKPSI